MLGRFILACLLDSILIERKEETWRSFLVIATFENVHETSGAENVELPSLVFKKTFILDSLEQTIIMNLI